MFVSRGAHVSLPSLAPPPLLEPNTTASGDAIFPANNKGCLSTAVFRSRSLWLDLVAITANLTVLVLYIMRSYDQEFTVATSSVNFGAQVLLTFQFFRHWSAVSRMRSYKHYLTTLPAFIDMVSIPSEVAALTGYYDTWLTMGFLRAASAYLMFDAVDARHLRTSTVLSDVHRQIIRMSFAFSASLCVFAGVVSTFEILGDPAGLYVRRGVFVVRVDACVSVSLGVCACLSFSL